MTVRTVRSESTRLTSVFALLWLGASVGALAGQAPVFRSAVDFIPVDVHVLDSEGRPVVGLKASDFEVTIDRRVRDVLSADFRQYADPDRLPALPVRSGAVAMNDFAPAVNPDRIFVLAIDSASLSDHESSGLIRALEGFVGRLSATDAVGFFTLPTGPSLRPTTNRSVLLRVIRTIAAGDGVRAGTLNLSPIEVSEIVNSPANPTGSTPNLPRSTPLPPDPDDVFRQVQMRECGSFRDRACTEALLLEAQNRQREIEQEVSASLMGIRSLLAALRDYEGPKAIILVSSGMPLSDGPGGWNSAGGEARTIGDEAARSRTSIYSLHIDRGSVRSFAPQSKDIRPATSRSRDLDERVLFDLAVASGGALFTVSVNAGDLALDRLLLETSSGYVLGVSADKLKLDGRTYALTVKLKTGLGGTITRHRKFVVLRPPTPTS